MTSQDLSLLVGERYLNDDIINFLIQKYCDKANAAREHTGTKVLLPSFLSMGKVSSNVVQRLSLTCDMERVENMLLPVHINDSHWGLAVFSVPGKTVYFDDGYHGPIPEDLKSNSNEILKIIHKTTGIAAHDPLLWKNIRRFKVPMPDQLSYSARSNHGCGNCGVAVI